MNKTKRETHVTVPLTTESKIQSLLFSPLQVDGSNFLYWLKHAKTILNSQDLAKAVIKPVASSSNADATDNVSTICKWQALHLIQRHLDMDLQMQYLEVDDPAELWAQLHLRFHHQRTLYQPQARTEWIQLRVMDFPSMTAYNSELHRIVSQLRYCGQDISDADLIEKTLSTFPPAQMTLSQVYRTMKFKKFSNLMAFLSDGRKERPAAAEERGVPTCTGGAQHNQTTCCCPAAAPAPEVMVEAHAHKQPEDPQEVLTVNLTPHTMQESRETMAREMRLGDIIRGMITQGENPLVIENPSTNLGSPNPDNPQVLVINVGVRDIWPRIVGHHHMW